MRLDPVGYEGAGLPRTAGRILVPVEDVRPVVRKSIPFHFQAPAAMPAFLDSAAFTVPGAGHLVHIEAVFPPGPAGLLHLRPMYATGQGVDATVRDVLDFVGAWPYIAGNQVTRQFPVMLALAPGDRLFVRYQNTDLVHPHAVIVDMQISFALDPWPRLRAVDV